MLHKCLNPACNAQFRYMNQGRLLQMRYADRSNAPHAGERRSNGEFFWLCHNCCENFRVMRTGDHFELIPVSDASEPPPFENQYLGAC